MNSILAAIVNGAILSAAVTAAVWLALGLMPRRGLNAATRYAVWWAALAAAVALNSCQLSAVSRQHTVAHAQPLATRSDAIASPAPRGDSDLPVLTGKRFVSSAPPVLRRAVFPVRIAAGLWPRWIAAAWSMTALLMLVRLLASCVLLERRVAGASAAPAHIAAHVDDWLARCGCRRRVRLASLEDIAAPMAAGLLRPSILIPARLFAELDESQLDLIGLHEAAHLARGDHYALVLQRILEALFALHPVVRWIARRIDLEREIACDDFVIGATGRPRSYAQCLTRVVELTGGVRASLVAAAAAEERSHLSRRVEMLLDKTRHTGTRLLKARLTAAVAALAALAWMAARTPGLVAFARPPGATVEPASSRRIVAKPAVQLSAAQAAPPANRRVTPPPVDTEVQLLSVVVTDPLDRFVTGLEENNFKLFEDGVEQKILQFSADVPISVGILFDTSASMGNLQASREAVAELFKTAPAEDEFFLVQFDDRPKLVQGFTTNTEEIRNKLTLIQSNGKTALLDGIYLAMHEMKKARNPRKALLLISDGGENHSRYTDSEIKNLLRETNIPVYAIGISETLSPARVEPDGSVLFPGLLGEVTGQTGGSHFDVDSLGHQLPDVARKIGIRLRNQYVLGYISTNTARDGRYRRVQVELTPPRGLPPLRAMHRVGYYAPDR